MRRLALPHLLLAIVAVACPALAQPPVAKSAYTLKVVTDRPEAIYKVGEKAKFTITLVKDGQPATGVELTYALSNDDYTPLEGGKLTSGEVAATVAGTLTEQLSWRWVFLGLVPFVLIGALLMLPVLRTLRPAHGTRTSKLADPRRVLHAFAVAGGIAALEAAGQHPSPLSVAFAILGLGALGWGLRTLLPAGTIGVRRGVAAPVAMRGILAGAFFGVEAIVPLSLTVQHGYSATEAGLPLACAGLAWALGSWWQGRDGHAEDPEHRVRLVRAGFVLVLLSALAVALSAQPGLPGWLIYPAWGLAGIGAGLTMSSVSVLLLDYTTDADRGADSAALQLSDATASAMTTGVAGVLVAAAARGALGYTAAFTILDVAMAAVALLGVLVAGQVRAPT